MSYRRSGREVSWSKTKYAYHSGYSDDDASEAERGRQPSYGSTDTKPFSPDCHSSARIDGRQWLARPVFFVIREHDHSVSPSPPPAPVRAEDEILERTASGISIARDTDQKWSSTQLLEDDEASRRVKTHMANFRRRFPNSTHERILRSLIHPKTTDAEYPIDNTALESIFFAANAMFFHGRLTQRVSWDWSHDSSTQYCTKIVGTTALRRSARRGLETLIVLSSPILRDTRYNRRLLISTFLHELIHSYLFICCGFRARAGGGHTVGFREIAELIDGWAGLGVLHLSVIEADLDRFRVREPYIQHQQPPTGRLSPSYPEMQGSCRHKSRYEDPEEVWTQQADPPQGRVSNTTVAQYTFGTPAVPCTPRSESYPPGLLPRRMAGKRKFIDDGTCSPY
jgi:hypothetical protein